MLLPGVGFDVVPSDCMAAHLKRRLADATHLRMYIGGLSSISRGTAKTMVEGISSATRVRRDGKLVAAQGALEGSCDFGQGAKSTMAVSWGDVSTAFYSTSIPNIEVHFEAVPQLKAATNIPGFVKSILGLAFMQRFLKSRIDRQPEGPSDEVRTSGYGIIVGEAWNAKGERVRSRLRTPEGYTLTALTGLDIARRVAAGEFKPGFMTPSLAFGADYVLGFSGVAREELNA
jgi:short subunit dehydrogenase-like uncharacterized protein